MNTGLWILILIVALILGIIIGYTAVQVQRKSTKQRLHDEAEAILTTANEEARTIQLQAKDKALDVKTQMLKSVDDDQNYPMKKTASKSGVKNSIKKQIN